MNFTVLVAQSKNLVMNMASIYNWNKKYSPIETEDGSSLPADDISKMQKQMLRLQEENEILKKAMAIFAKK
ncbi:hypothetical protein V1503_23775 [Bacillus sp. SCS-151]|uniref:hypothetical protein n=1 Tax=Nanhaiella sioensis TaxID=3115293 RepID=UPI00397B65D0